jgi:small-conductance mechanosensitive channel
MNSIADGNKFLDAIATPLTMVLGRWLEQLLGPAAARPVLGPLSGSDLGVALCLLLLVLFLHLVLFVFVRQEPKASAGAPQDRRLHRQVFAALDKPAYVLIWVYGVYLAVTPLLLKIDPDGGASFVRAAFDKGVDLGVFAIVFWLFFRFTRVLEAQLAAWSAGTDSQLDNLLVPMVGRSLRVIMPVLGIILALPILGLPPQYAGILGKGTSILLIVAVAIILVQAVGFGEKAVLARFDIGAQDNLRARTIYTQVHVISKVVYAGIGIFTMASILMLFQEVRQLGTSILASAGVLGIIIGFAAQKTIANLFAGFQIAMTQPIRLDDVVIVEGEWGRVQEITLTYVVIHIWDDRRLIVPLAYFIDKPFQNWTRTSAELLGSVVMWVDYAMPLDALRKALKEIIEPHPLWDQRFWNLQVTDTTEKCMQLRVLATTADSSKGWDLRCDIREKMIVYIQQNHPECLPQFRVQTSGEGCAPLAQP